MFWPRDSNSSFWRKKANICMHVKSTFCFTGYSSFWNLHFKQYTFELCRNKFRFIVTLRIVKFKFFCRNFRWLTFSWPYYWHCGSNHFWEMEVLERNKVTDKCTETVTATLNTPISVHCFRWVKMLMKNSLVLLFWLCSIVAVTFIFTIAAEILARSLADFHCQ